MNCTEVFNEWKPGYQYSNQLISNAKVIKIETHHQTFLCYIIKPIWPKGGFVVPSQVDGKSKHKQNPEIFGDL